MLRKFAYPLSAILVLAGILAFILLQPARPEIIESDLFNPEQEKLESILHETGSFGFAAIPKTKDDSLALALSLYKENNFTEAQELLSLLIFNYPDNLTAQFYLGLTHLYQQSPNEAFRLLLPLSELRNFEMQDDAAWYAALAASNVQKKQAHALFTKLSTDPSSKYREAANAVLASASKYSGDYEFQPQEGNLSKSVLAVMPATGWWQSGWVRILSTLLLCSVGLGLIFWRKRNPVAADPVASEPG